MRSWTAWGDGQDPSRGGFRRLPIIAMTAHATVEERERLPRRLACRTISKPIDPGAVRDGASPLRPTEAAAPHSDAADAASAPAVAPGPTADALPVVARAGHRGRPAAAGRQPALYLKLLRQFESSKRMPRRGCRPCGGRGPCDGRTAGPRSGCCRQPRRRAGPGGGAELEHAIVASAPPVELEAAQSTLDERLTALVGGLRQALGVEEAATATSADGAPPDPEALAAAIDQMQAYLRDFDAAAIDHLEANRPVPGGVSAGCAGAAPGAPRSVRARRSAGPACAASERLERGGRRCGGQSAEHHDRDRDGRGRARSSSSSATWRSTTPRAGPAGVRERAVQLAVGSAAFVELRQRIEAACVRRRRGPARRGGAADGLEPENDHPAPSTSTAAATDDPQAVQQAIDQLRHYLNEWDAAAVDHLEANRELVRARFSREAFAELEQRIKAFAFDEASAQLEEAVTSHAG